MAEFHNPPELWLPFGKFSMIALQANGKVVHFKGQVSLDREGNIVGRGDMRAQVRQTLGNIETALASIGGIMADVISLVHYTTDIDLFMKTGDIREEFFKAPYPVTTTVEVKRLYDPALMIEIAAIAEVPAQRLRMPG